MEQHGIESIPERDRTATIFDFMRIEWGGLNSLATAVLGAFPIIFGLSFWQSVAATVLGVMLGSLILAPMGLFGPLTGTNNAVSSSAHFGVVGRILGSFLSLLTAVAFFSISVWASGDAVIGAAQRLFGLRPSDLSFAGAYAAFAIAVLVVAIYGFRLMLLVNKIAVVAASLLFIVGFYAFYPAFDQHFAGAGLGWGTAKFWPAFVGAALVVLANPISFGAFLGDWSRYLPRATNRRHLILASILAQTLSLVPFIFGLVTTSIIARLAPHHLDQVDYTGGLVFQQPDQAAGAYSKGEVRSPGKEAEGIVIRGDVSPHQFRYARPIHLGDYRRKTRDQQAQNGADAHALGCREQRHNGHQGDSGNPCNSGCPP